MFDQLRPANVTSSGFVGSIAAFHRLSWLAPPMSVAYFRSAAPAPSSLRRAIAASCDPFQVRSNASGVVTNTWTLLRVTHPHTVTKPFESTTRSSRTSLCGPPRNVP
ncbi:MAG: hypothetical protein DMG03_05235 [Acidobacteria bacterium]|nr:MAG: hypothetical protein DMG03_05235 [Acidobacteriota bacterium]